MLGLLIAGISLTLFYVGLMYYYLKAWEDVPESQIAATENWPAVSVLIPVRNEAANIAQLIEDILAQDYPVDQLEIIVIDDHSTDNTASIVKGFSQKNVRLLDLEAILANAPESAAYKKRAIEAGVQHAKGDWILTTDGDCRLGVFWVKSMVSAAWQQDAKLVTGPVLLAPYQSLFEQFQSLDFQGMIGITAASLHRGMYNLANGANLLYEKAAFLAVDGYKDIDQTPSGDDMLLVYKIAKAYHGSVAFVKNTNAIVATKPMASLDDFLQQRFRWTSKSRHYQDKRITAILGLVYLSVLMIPLNIIVGFFCCPMLILIAGIQFFSKSVIDYIFLGKMAAWYRREELLKTFWSSQVMHIIYIVGVGTLGNILQYKWKGRKLK